MSVILGMTTSEFFHVAILRQVCLKMEEQHVLSGMYLAAFPNSLCVLTAPYQVESVFCSNKSCPDSVLIIRLLSHAGLRGPFLSCQIRPWARSQTDKTNSAQPAIIRPQQDPDGNEKLYLILKSLP